MKAYFFRLNPHKASDSSFDACINQLVSHCKGQGDGAYIDCGGLHLRFENYQRTSNYCTGEIIRQQRDDLPPLAPIGKALQPNINPLGHGTAFLYHYDTRVLVLQVNKDGVGAGSIISCIKQNLNHHGFAHVPLLNKNTIQELIDGGARSVTVKFASPDNLSVADNDKKSDVDNLNNMRALFDAPSIEVTCGFDTPKKGSLNVKAVAKFIRQLQHSPVTPQKIQVKQEGQAELLDLLGKKLSYSDSTVHPDSKNLQKHYQVRKAFLEDAFAENETYIVECFSEAA